MSHSSRSSGNGSPGNSGGRSAANNPKSTVGVAAPASSAETLWARAYRRRLSGGSLVVRDNSEKSCRLSLSSRSVGPIPSCSSTGLTALRTCSHSDGPP